MFENLRRANIATGLGFWENTAGFDISQTLIEYSSSVSTYGRAFWVGLLNTLLVAVLGIFFTTILGFAIGIARLHLKNEPEVDVIMSRVQNDLFDLGADFAVPETEGAPKERLRVVEAQVTRLETEIDQLNASLKPLRSFILPGGEPSAAFLHQGRTICRRAERLAVLLSQNASEKVNPAAIRYLNRLSDLLFVAARYVNGRGERDVLWVPGANR